MPIWVNIIIALFLFEVKTAAVAAAAGQTISGGQK